MTSEEELEKLVDEVVRGARRRNGKSSRKVSPHGVACAAEAVKGLRSPSLAPMNDANYKTVRVALDCLPRYGWKVHKGSCRSPFENGTGHYLIQAGFLSNDWGRGLNYRFYAMAGAGLLHYSNMAVSELMRYFNQHVYSHVARGTILIMPEDRARCVIQAESFSRRAA